MSKLIHELDQSSLRSDLPAFQHDEGATTRETRLEVTALSVKSRDPFGVDLSGIDIEVQAGEIVGKGDMGAQIRQVGENLKAALAAAGATLADLVRTQTFTTDIDEFFKHVGVRMEYFAALPTSTTVEVRRLSHPDFLVEVEAIAVVENK